MAAARRRLRTGTPVWLDGAPPQPQRYARLSGTRRTRIAIVGGGITGALTAHAFAAAGVPVVLLEAARVAQGSTAASSALLLKEPDHELTRLAQRYGHRRASRIWRISHESVDGLIALLQRLSVRCDLHLRDTVHFATDAEAADRLRREWALRRRAGFDAEWIDRAALHRLTGVSAAGGIRTSGSARFDPYRACLGILGAAERAGAQIFERSRVTRITPQADGVRLHTDHGVVDADRVIIATGYATRQFRPLIGRFRMYHTYVIGTAPLRASERRPLGMADLLLWSTGQPYHYARFTGDHRLLLGGADVPVRPRQRPAALLATARRELRDYFEPQFPALADIATPIAWQGLFAMTPDSLPYIGPHRRYPRHWFALGYGGNGMTFAFLAARLLLERWQGTGSADHALFEFGRVRRR